MIDGELLTDTPVKVLASQPDRALPLLCGYATEEFRFQPRLPGIRYWLEIDTAGYQYCEVFFPNFIVKLFAETEFCGIRRMPSTDFG